MALHKQLGTIELSSLTAAAYQSASYSQWYETQPGSYNWAIQARVGNLATGSGNLKVFLDQTMDDPDAVSAVNIVSVTALGALTATSAVQTLIGATPPLLPYMRVGVRVEAAASGIDFKNIVIKLLTE